MRMNNLYLSTITFCGLLTFVRAVEAASVGSAFYGDAPDQHHPWAVHDPNRPQPKIITPGTFSSQQEPGKPPADAIVLFAGEGNSPNGRGEREHRARRHTGREGRGKRGGFPDGISGNSGAG